MLENRLAGLAFIFSAIMVGGEVLFTCVVLYFAILVLLCDILAEIMRLSGMLLRQKVLSLKGPHAADIDHIYLSFCCHFYLIFINLLLVFSSSKNLQVKDFNAS